MKGVAYTLLTCWLFCPPGDAWDCVGGSRIMEVWSMFVGKLNVFD